MHGKDIEPWNKTSNVEKWRINNHVKCIYIYEHKTDLRSEN